MVPALRLRYFLFSIFTGLWTAPLLPISSTLIIILLFVLLLVGVNKKPFWGIGLFLFLLSHLYSLWWPVYQMSNDNLAQWVHENTEITGTVANWPKISNRDQQFHFRVSSIDHHSAEGKVLVTIPNTNKIKYGDQLQFTGKLKPPRRFSDFDYAAYLKRFQIQFVVQPSAEINISPNQHSLFPLIWVKSQFEKNINRSLPSPNAELATGVLIGTKKDLPSPYKDAFKQAGLQHLIVVSGSNVALIILLCAFLFRQFGPTIRTIATVSILLGFLFITGADPPVLRASLLGIIATFALHTGRPIDTPNLLLFAAILMGIINPLIVQQDISFWLSFSATAGILFGFPIWQHYFVKDNHLKIISMIFGISFCAQLAVLPVLIMYFEVFPWIGLISNVFAEPLIPLTMLTSFIAGLTGFLPSTIHQIISFPAFICTELLNWLGLFFGTIPGINIPSSIGKAFAVFWMGTLIWILFHPFYAQKFTMTTQHYLDDPL